MMATTFMSARWVEARVSGDGSAMPGQPALEGGGDQVGVDLAVTGVPRFLVVRLEAVLQERGQVRQVLPARGLRVEAVRLQTEPPQRLRRGLIGGRAHDRGERV